MIKSLTDEMENALSDVALSELLKKGWTIIMVGKINFQGKCIFRKHLNLNTEVHTQIAHFQEKCNEANDWASVKISFMKYSPIDDM
jgi:hypothetical protein